ncbi:ABC transporter permease [Desnuesiella massiliensis]|uniref:ABC transporter permease n=1 Tax=Desnuesiella massiliensis TaxID=1650662 RepID=UPI0006E2096A|nr:ABC transporter permease [Desnuesiella massiliensis]
MSRVFTIAKYEFKMQFGKVGFWLILIIATALALIDNFPSAANLNRLPQLIKQGYVVSRLLPQPGVILLFGFVFLIANQICGDVKKGIDEIFMVKPLSRSQYVFGKFFGNFIFVILLFVIYLAINGFAQAVWTPGNFVVYPYIIAFICVIIPASIFVVGCSLAFPILIDIRFFYALFSTYFMWNLIITPDGDKLPFYLLLSGDLTKLLYNYGLAEPSSFKILFNAAFLVITGILSLLLLLPLGRFWREK